MPIEYLLHGKLGAFRSLNSWLILSVYVLLSLCFQDNVLQFKDKFITEFKKA